VDKVPFTAVSLNLEPMCRLKLPAAEFSMKHKPLDEYHQLDDVDNNSYNIRVEYVVHAGVDFKIRKLNKIKLRFIFDPTVGIYFFTKVFKDRTLCGTIITVYQVESIFVTDWDQFENDIELLAISWRKGTCPLYYTDPTQMPRSNHTSDHFSGQIVNCPLCLAHKKFPLWTLARTVL